MITVSGILEDSTGVLLDVAITFKSQSTPQVRTGGLVTCNTVDTIRSSASDGTFSITLEQGLYAVSIGSTPETDFFITVPSGTSSANIDTLVSSGIPSLPPAAPYDLWNGIWAGSIQFAPLTDPATASTSPTHAVSGHQTGTDAFKYQIVFQTQYGTTAGSTDVVSTGPTGGNNATLISWGEPPAGVTQTLIYRSIDGSSARYLLAMTAASTLQYVDFESQSDFVARYNPAQTVPIYNTTAGGLLGDVNTPWLYITRSGILIPAGAAAGYVLTSDASGLATWQAASGGGGGGGGVTIVAFDPNGVTTGSPGDMVYNSVLGKLWLKVTGTATNTGWQQLI